MKRHHSQREAPAGQLPRYVLAPVKVGAIEVGGRKAALLIWVRRAHGAMRNLDFLCAKSGITLTPVQVRTGDACFEAIGEPEALARLVERGCISRWDYDAYSHRRARDVADADRITDLVE